MKFLEPTRKPKVIYTDNSLEFGKSCEELSGIIVRRHHTDQKQMRLLKEQCVESRKGHLQFCCNQVWTKKGGQIPWNVTAICETFRTFLSDGKTPYERQFGMPLSGPVIPFEAMVEHHPISAKDESRPHQFGPKVWPGTFLGYALYAEGIWKGDILVADIEELEETDASELHARRLYAKEVLPPQRSGNFIFPVADGTVKIFGG